MSRIPLLAFLLFFSMLSFAQKKDAYKIVGVVMSSETGKPLSNIKISLAGSKTTNSDENGDFTFSELLNGKYTLVLSDSANKMLKDTNVTINNADIDILLLEIKDCGKYARNNVVKSIQSGTACLVAAGGVAPIYFIADDSFKKKYGVGICIYGCNAPASRECLITNNQTIFKHLTLLYGRKWRKDIREDIIGLRK